MTNCVLLFIAILCGTHTCDSYTAHTHEQLLQLSTERLNSSLALVLALSLGHYS